MNNLTIASLEHCQEASQMAYQRGTATQRGTGSIARRLARLRRECGITQQQMAKKLGISQRVFSGYERGELRLHGELIVQLVKILKVSTDDLLGIKPAKQNGSRKAARLLNRLRKVEQLPNADQTAVLKFVDALLQTRGVNSTTKQRKAS